MTIRAQVEFIRDSLAEWARTWSADAKLAHDRADVLRLILSGPDHAHCYVYFEKEETIEAYRHSGGVERTYLIVMSRGRGLALSDAGNLVAGVPGEQPLFDVLEQGRTLLMNLNFVPTQDSAARDREQILPRYIGTRLWRGGISYELDAFEIEISILTQIVA